MSRHLLTSDLGVTVTAYGAKGDGTTDDTTAIQSALTAASTAHGGNVIFPPGVYRSAAQLTLTAPAYGRVNISAYGAELKPDAGVSGLKITGGSTTGGVSVHGLRVNHMGNNTAACAFEIVQGWKAKLFDCAVDASSTNPAYAAVLIRSTTPTNESTGSYWTRIDNLDVRSRSGSGNLIAYGVKLLGAANATKITGSTFSTCKYAIRVEPEAGDQYLADTVVFEGNTFEGVETGISVYGVDLGGSDKSYFLGHRYFNNRFEAITGTCFEFTGAMSVGQMPLLAGNMIIGSPTYVTNTANTTGIQYTSLDQKGLTQGHLIAGDGTRLKGVNSGYHPVIVEALPSSTTTPHGVQFVRAANPDNGGEILRMGGINTNVHAVEISAPLEGSTPWLYVAGLRGMSSTATRAQNLRGSATFATAATKTVAFSVAETDANYFVAISKNANEEVWITGKTTAGFTLNSSNASSTATVDWILVR